MSMLKIYMESGNVLTERFVKNYNFKWCGDEITSLTIERHWWSKYIPHQRIHVSSIVLSRIEAICNS